MKIKISNFIPSLFVFLLMQAGGSMAWCTVSAWITGSFTYTCIPVTAAEAATMMAAQGLAAGFFKTVIAACGAFTVVILAQRGKQN